MKNKKTIAIVALVLLALLIVIPAICISVFGLETLLPAFPGLQGVKSLPEIQNELNATTTALADQIMSQATLPVAPTIDPDILNLATPAPAPTMPAMPTMDFDKMQKDLERKMYDTLYPYKSFLPLIATGK